jgi:hypothetical protein
MKTPKAKILEVIDSLPEDVTWDEVLRACYVRALTDLGVDPQVLERATAQEVDRWFWDSEFRAERLAAS